MKNLRLHGGYGWFPNESQLTPKTMKDETTLEDILITACGKFSGTRPDYTCDEWEKLRAEDHTIIWRGTSMVLAADMAIKAGANPDELSDLGIFVSAQNVKVVAPPPLESEGFAIDRLRGGCPPTTC
jgi:hypothetical protein